MYKISKADRSSRQKKLVPMPTEKRPFQEIAMYFIAELQETEDFNTILVVTAQFTKVQHYMLARTTCTAEDIANSNSNDI